ncbi:hypothetical protein [Enemella dayhoffiae]|nr:hypothetical protein [Enemella dayhoffiae]
MTVTAIAAVLGALAQLLGLPGAAVLWVGMLVGSRMHPPAVMTGRKDPKTQMVQPATPAEETARRRHLYWSQMPLLPGGNWLPGWLPRADWLTGMCVALVAWGLPAAWDQLRWVNAVAAFTVCVAVNAAARNNPRDGDPRPAVALDSLPKAVATHKVSAPVRFLLAFAAAAVACWAVGWAVALPVVQHLWAEALLQLLARAPKIPVQMLEPTLCGEYVVDGVSLLAGGLGIAGIWSSVALESWRLLATARSEWAPRWEQIGAKKPPSCSVRISRSAELDGARSGRPSHRLAPPLVVVAQGQVVAEFVGGGAGDAERLAGLFDGEQQRLAVVGGQLGESLGHFGEPLRLTAACWAWRMASATKASRSGSVRLRVREFVMH